jgi:hypothetical protein
MQPDTGYSLEMALSKRREVAAATARRRVFGRLNVPLLAIITVALAARVAWIAATDFRPTLIDDAGRYDLLGRSLADNAGFVNPNGHLTMYWPPGYPFILAALYKLYPHWLLADHTVKAALLLNALLGTATVALVYAIGVRAFGRKAALAGAAITALFPSLVFFAGVTLSETAFTFLLLLALWLLIEAEARDCRLLIVAGLVVGFASLVRGQALLLPLVALPFWWASAHGHRQVRPGVTAATGATPVMEFEDVSAQPPAWRDLTMRLAVVGGLALLVVAPWTARNYVESHSLVLISSNSGVDFYIGHSAGADGRGRIVNDFVFRYPDLPPAEAEARISNDGFHDGLTYAVHHPLREVTLSARKVFFLYYRDRAAVDWIDSHGERHVLASSLQHALWLLSDAYYYAVIALAVVGVRRWFSLRDPVRLLLVSLAVYWTLVHVAFFADPRFHAPIMPVLALWAGMGVMWGQAQSRRVILSRFKSLAMHEAEG